MAGDVDVAVEPLSRDEILADLRELQSDFGRLFMTDCVANLTTYRHYWPSRFPNGGDRRSRRPILGRPDEAWLHHRVGDGLEVNPLPVRSIEDVESAPIFYGPSGEPWVNSAGQSMLMAPGWSGSHEIKLRGPGSVRANETIDRANRWAFDAMSLWWPVLLLDRSPGYVSDASMLWPCVVAFVAERARRSLLKPNEWFVEAGGQSYSLDVWRRRDEFGLGGPMVTDEVAKEIGDEPEHVYAVRTAFLRDSELAAKWLAEQLAEQLAEPVDDEPERVGAMATGELPLQYDNQADLEMDAWIYKSKVKDKMTWPKLIAELGKVAPGKNWKPLTSEPGLRERLKRYYIAVLKKDYEHGERGNPVNKRKSREKQGSPGKPKA